MTEKIKKSITGETFVCAGVFIGFFVYVGKIMGIGNLFNTLMNTAHDLILNTVLFIMGIAILAGAFAAVLSEFGVIALINRLITPVMRPVYGLPGAAALGILTTFLSDNPAIIGLAKDKGFSKYFQNFELPTLCNLGTAFGMGLLVWTFMGSQGIGMSFFRPATLGLLGAIVGSIVSVRMMMHFTKDYYNITEKKSQKDTYILEHRKVRDGSPLSRALEAALDGGKNGIQMGIEIMPGVVIICTLVMLLTFQPVKDASGNLVFTGAAYEGIGLIPQIGAKLQFIIEPLFGIKSPEALAFPLTALGSVGAAMGMVPKLIASGAITGNEIAVFTSMGMCWSGYLSTHIGMMDALGVRELSGKAILSHTIGGLCGGLFAHGLFIIFC